VRGCCVALIVDVRFCVKSIRDYVVCSQIRRDKMWKHLLFVFVATTTILHETVIAFSLPISQSQSIKQTLSPLAASSSSTDSNTPPLLHDLTLFSPCKINLFLRILRKRPDGYHDLASLFQTVAFGDTLHLKMDPNAVEDSMECNMAGVPVDKTNLVLRAIELVKVKTGRMDTFFRANLVKQVPAQAGLGGGSGNAAAAMWGTNVLLGSPATLEQVEFFSCYVVSLWHLVYSPPSRTLLILFLFQLVDWSAALGSDITFFLSQGTAYCTGRGEIMRPVPSMNDGTKLYIVKPAVGLSTPSVFKALQYDKLSSMDPEMLLDRFLTHGAVDAGEHCYVNDLELPAFICAPELQALKDELKAVKGFKYVMMSGSGSSIFCIGEPEDKEAFNKKFAAREDLSIFPSEFISRKESQWFQAIAK
jgi:4-diphosphocytidyl-2-C-methyl-D-erythritol kinase